MSVLLPCTGLCALLFPGFTQSNLYSLLSSSSKQSSLIGLSKTALLLPSSVLPYQLLSGSPIIDNLLGCSRKCLPKRLLKAKPGFLQQVWVCPRADALSDTDCCFLSPPPSPVSLMFQHIPDEDSPPSTPMMKRPTISISKAPACSAQAMSRAAARAKPLLANRTCFLQREGNSGPWESRGGGGLGRS